MTHRIFLIWLYIFYLTYALSTSLSKFQPGFMSTTCWFSNVCMCKCVFCEDIYVVLWSQSSTCNFCSLCSIHLVCWEGLSLTWNSLIMLACLYSELKRVSPFCHFALGLKIGTVTFKQGTVLYRLNYFPSLIFALWCYYL